MIAAPAALTVNAATHQTRFDIMLMLLMPIMDGLESIRLIRADEQAARRSRTPIAVLSTNSMPEHVEASRAIGGDLHIA